MMRKSFDFQKHGTVVKTLAEKEHQWQATSSHLP
jgi:hypothetical protein